jgi:hypothetical protein
MKTLRLKIFGRFGNEMAMNPDEISVVFPYLGDRVLTKFLTKGGVKLLDSTKGEIEVTLDDFEIQGLNVGEKQSFIATISEGAKKIKVSFPGGLSVDTINDRKSIR